jgi:hypothetical protein
MKKQQSVYGEMKVELQRRQVAEREARERARQMRETSQDRIRESGDEKSAQQVNPRANVMVTIFCDFANFLCKK